jgi:ATPase
MGSMKGKKRARKENRGKNKNRQKNAVNSRPFSSRNASFDKIVPDTSVIVEGILSMMLSSNKLNIKTIIMHEAVLAELESQANKNRETGYLGLEEVKKLRALSTKKGFKIEHKGSRPGDFEIKFAKSGEIDSLIRELALKEGATLITADIVQSKVAEAKGIPVFLYKFPAQQEVRMQIEKYFSKDTMSVHLKEGVSPMAKIGTPASSRYVKLSKSILTKEELQELSKDIVETAKGAENSFFETDRKGSTIIQAKTYRIIITRPPFSDSYEITAVRPIRSLRLEEYGIGAKLTERLLNEAQGVLVIGAPGAGKSTFVQSVSEKYVYAGKNVKTIESPRDLVVPKEVTRYNPVIASAQEVSDVILLSRPDVVLFDEMRSPEDFKLFLELRLSGVGMLSTLHAAAPVDAIERLCGKIDLGLISNIVDTIILVKGGKVEKICSVSLQMKVPFDMDGKARPVVVISDFGTQKPEYEIYSFDAQLCVVEVKKR